MHVMTAPRLRELRLQHGLSQEQLGDVLKVSHSAVNRWEGGQEIPGPAALLLEWLFLGDAPFETKAAAAELGSVVREDIGEVAMTVDAFEECLRRSREAGFASVTEWIADLVREELNVPVEGRPLERQEVRYGK
jgi:transcriptional regulator with XRE-family HTH domain